MAIHCDQGINSVFRPIHAIRSCDATVKSGTFNSFFGKYPVPQISESFAQNSEYARGHGEHEHAISDRTTGDLVAF
jgi:hypothetical protein